MSRYNRQELLSFIGRKGQQQLLRSTVAVVGMGALGTVATELLARSGVGKLVIVDRDVVELTDLQRQLLYDESDVGKPKATTAAAKLKKINSEIKIVAAAADIDHKNIQKIVGKPDIILDCTDNLETRFLINEYCLKNRIPWIHAAAIRETGQLMVFDFRSSSNLPCFACAFRNSTAEGTCDTVGVLSTATIAVAAMQATAAIRALLRNSAKSGMRNRASPDLRSYQPSAQLLRLNVWTNELTKIAIKKNPGCSSHKYEYLSGKKKTAAVAMCGRSSYQVKGKAVDVEKLKLRLQKMGEKVADFGECISFRNITLFADGRALVKADSAEKAKADYARYLSH